MNAEQTLKPEDQGNTFYVILISCIATIGGFLFGYDSGVINGTVDGLQAAFDSDSVGTGFNVASMLLGCAVGAFFAGGLADRHGRRFIMRVAAIFFIVSAWGSGIADSSLEFVSYRMLGGLAQWASNFVITMTFPVLLAGVGLAGAYCFYTLCAFLSIWFVVTMIRETRGIELEDMQG